MKKIIKWALTRQPIDYFMMVLLIVGIILSNTR